MHHKYLPDTPEDCLAHLVEECGELIAAIGKCQRFGFDAVNPEIPPYQQETNRLWVLREISDVQSAIERFRLAIE